MNLSEKIDEDLRVALKGQDANKASVLRLLKSAIKNAEITKNALLSEQEIISTLEKQAKQRKDSIEQYRSGNRPDLASKEEGELEIINAYLPQKFSQEETEKLVDEVIRDLGAESISQMGQVMKETMSRANGQADGSVVSKIVKEKLS
jgi:uncharacterized protein YqeY